jgi:cytochrome c oxidase subunit 3
MEMTTNKTYSRSKIHPKKFALWVGIASIAMMFAAFTSAYIVRKAAGNWLEFELPGLFWVSAVVILISSLTLHLGYRAFLNQKKRLYRSMLWVTLGLGLAFVALQYEGWMQLMASGVELTTNPSGSFVYVLSGLHVAHVMGGLAVLAVALIHGLSLPFRPTPTRKLRLELTATYWHFVDLLWLYLLLFFTFQ